MLYSSNSPLDLTATAQPSNSPLKLIVRAGLLEVELEVNLMARQSCCQTAPDALYSVQCRRTQASLVKTLDRKMSCRNTSLFSLLWSEPYPCSNTKMGTNGSNTVSYFCPWDYIRGGGLIEGKRESWGIGEKHSVIDFTDNYLWVHTIQFKI